MSIASQLTALESNISNAYDMVAQRGGTVPARKNMENLDDAIATIPSGGVAPTPSPTGTVQVSLESGTAIITDMGKLSNFLTDRNFPMSQTSMFEYCNWFPPVANEFWTIQNYPFGMTMTRQQMSDNGLQIPASYSGRIAMTLTPLTS